jgi:hypothetical protein
MNILFCNDPFEPKKIDSDFEEELLAARQSGFAVHLFSYDTLVKEGDGALATKHVKPIDTQEIILYRGWMLKPDQYALLYESLLAKNYRLINSPEEYRHCHHFPASYHLIEELTPKSIWLHIDRQLPDYDAIFNAIREFGDSALLLKDYVKSQKHYWDTACFIPSASDNEKVKAVVERFVELQGVDLNEGLVFRRFAELEDLTIHSKSGMPLKEEYRLFFFNRELIGCYNYWEEGDYQLAEPPLSFFKDVAARIQSNFFSMDIAKTKNKDWLIIELGDGQVAGLPEAANKEQFYTRIKEICLSTELHRGIFGLPEN